MNPYICSQERGRPIQCSPLGQRWQRPGVKDENNASYSVWTLKGNDVGTACAGSCVTPLVLSGCHGSLLHGCPGPEKPKHKRYSFVNPTLKVPSKPSRMDLGERKLSALLPVAPYLVYRLCYRPPFECFSIWIVVLCIVDLDECGLLTWRIVSVDDKASCFGLYSRCAVALSDSFTNVEPRVQIEVVKSA